MKYIWHYLIAIFIGTSFSATMLGQSYQNRVDFMGEYYWQPLLYNPCFAGSMALPTVGISGRWSGEGGRNPYTIHGFAHFNVDTIKSSFGITATYHRYDDTFAYGGDLYPTNKVYLSVNALYNYHFILSQNAAIQVGVQGGFLHFNTQDPISISPVPQPVTLLNENTFKLDIGFGVLLTVRNFYIGAALAHTNEPKFQFVQPGAIHQFGRDLYLQSGYSFSIADKLHIQPAVMLQSYLSSTYWNSTNAAVQPVLDINLQLDYLHRFFVATSYRINTPFFMSVKAGTRLGKMQLSAAYHFGKNTSAASHRLETTLGWFLWAEDE